MILPLASSIITQKADEKQQTIDVRNAQGDEIHN